MISKISTLDSCDTTVKSIRFDSLETGLKQYATYKDFASFKTLENGFKYELSNNLIIIEFIDENLEDLYERY